MMVLSLATAFALAQDPASLFEKAPPHVEEALRARVTKFYQAHVDGKFRAALALAAEDSADAFLGADKTRCRSFEIVKLTFKENFSRAVALVSCETDFVMPASKPIPVNQPQTSLWKLADGEWVWYLEPVDPSKGVVRGGWTFRPGPADPASEQPLARLGSFNQALASVQAAVRISKMEVKLSSFEPTSDEITITNGLPGAITLSLDPLRTPGLEVALEPAELKANQTGRVVFRYTPPDKLPKSALTAVFRVQPTQQAIGVLVTFAAPPQDQKQLPQ